jgi:hypothetical protein
VHLLDEVPEHLLGDVEVGDDTVLQRADRNDVRRGSPDHALGFGAHREDGTGLCVDRYDGGLIQDDPAPTHIDERVCGPKVDGHVSADELEHAVHRVAFLPASRPRT